MRGGMIFCSNESCKKLIIKNAFIRVGSYFTIRCFHCGTIERLSCLDKDHYEVLIEKIGMRSDLQKLPPQPDNDIVFMGGA